MVSRPHAQNCSRKNCVQILSFRPLISKGKVKLNPALLSADMSQERMARALAILGNAFTEASNALLGKPTRSAGNLLSQVPRGCPLTVNELINEFLLAKARAGRSDRYLRQIRVVMSSFNTGRGRTSIEDVAVHDIEQWTRNAEWSARTVRGYVADVRTMFNYAVRRGYIERNPAAGVELPVLPGESKIQVHTPSQAQKILETARRADLDVCRRLAIRYFAGVRSAEANRLTEEDLKLDQDLIEVPAVKSKTRARRLVTIQPNLKAWLALGGELRGMTDATVRNVIKLAKVEWPHNVTRHSFVSYHLAKFNNAGKTALEAGHTEQMLFKHYRALVTPSAAEEFWAIVP